MPEDRPRMHPTWAAEFEPRFLSRGDVLLTSFSLWPKLRQGADARTSRCVLVPDFTQAILHGTPDLLHLFKTALQPTALSRGPSDMGQERRLPLPSVPPPTGDLYPGAKTASRSIRSVFPSRSRSRREVYGLWQIGRAVYPQESRTLLSSIWTDRENGSTVLVATAASPSR